jgi:hypothetical protein
MANLPTWKHCSKKNSSGYNGDCGGAAISGTILVDFDSGTEIKFLPIIHAVGI